MEPIALPQNANESKQVRVLIVDDSPVQLLAIAAWLATVPGVNVVAQAASGGEALAGIDDARPDLVLTDVEMPGMSGFDLARQVRQKTNAPRVVIMSASDQPDYGPLSRRSGADAFIHKNQIRDLLPRYLKTEFGAVAI